MALDLTFFIFLQVIFVITLIGTLVSCACWKNTSGGHEYPTQSNHNAEVTTVNYIAGNEKVTINLKANGNEHIEKTTGGNRKLPDIPPAESGEETPPIDGTSQPYDTVNPLTSQTIDTDSETYATPYLVGARTTESSECAETLMYEPPPPPVPEKHFEDDNQVDNFYSTISNPSTADVIAGTASLENIPLITSPIMDSEEGLDIDNTRESPSSALDYTFISVREPLKNIIAQTNTLGRESHYTVVQEDGDQTYAEIESAQNSASSTYGHLGPGGKASDDSVPPVPPPVETLISVAKAHSRQASCSSFVSTEATSPHSPNSDRDHASWGAFPRNVHDLSYMYSTVNKPKKSSTAPRAMESTPSVSNEINDLYAKVQKHAQNSVEEWPGARPKTFAAGSSQTKRHSWASGSHKVPASPCGSDHFGERRSIEEEDQYASESLHNSLRGGSSVSSSTTADRRSPSGSFQGRHFVHPNGGGDLVPSPLPPVTYGAYESIRRKGVTGGGYDDEESEPGYEKVNRSTAGVGGGDEESVDPGYEIVANRNGEISDPNYESIYYNVNELQTFDGRTDDPSYWQIRLRSEVGDPLYERIKNQEDDSTDPNYEKVKTGSELSYEASEPGYERVKQHNLSEDGYGYQKVKDVNDRLLTNDSCDPGYEMIPGNVLELHVEWGQEESDSKNPCASAGKECNYSTGIQPVDVHSGANHSSSNHLNSEELHMTGSGEIQDFTIDLKDLSSLHEDKNRPSSDVP